MYESVKRQSVLIATDLLNDLCGLQGTALLGGVNALHTSFPDDPEEEYKTQGRLFSIYY